jgi:hypothetical protein
MSSLRIPATVNVPARTTLQKRLGALVTTLRAAVRQSVATPDKAPLASVVTLLKSLPTAVQGRLSTGAKTRVATLGVTALAVGVDNITLLTAAGIPTPKTPSAIAGAAKVSWTGKKYARLYLDSIACVHSTAEIDKDEISIFGTLLDMGAGESRTIPRTYLGKFKTGTVLSYHAEGGRFLSYADLSNARVLPTYAAAILGLVEEDANGWAVFLADVYSRVRPLLAAAVDEAISIDSGVGDLTAAEVEAILQDLVMFVSDELIDELDALSNDDFFRNVARTASPPIAVPATDSWGGDWKSDVETLFFDQGSAHYKVKVFWKRTDTV